MMDGHRYAIKEALVIVRALTEDQLSFTVEWVGSDAEITIHGTDEEIKMGFIRAENAVKYFLGGDLSGSDNSIPADFDWWLRR